jgi:CBS domain-containing protein
MKVSEKCQRNVVSVRPHEELISAAHLMRDKHVGYLVVIEPALVDGTYRPIGVLTDRDLVVSVLAREANPRSLRIEDVMTRMPRVVRADQSLADAVQEMRRIGVRRLPVIGDHGELFGVISLDDIVETLATQLHDVADSIRTEQAVEHALRP